MDCKGKRMRARELGGRGARMDCQGEGGEQGRNVKGREGSKDEL